MDWSKEQKEAIKTKGNNILVSAAAGSGKTTVLVERIVNKVLNEKVDIDKLLVCTFTNAAASEMKQRLLDRLYKEMDKNPNDENIPKQIFLINTAHISTIHSFCLDVIRNNFYELDISNNFRIADQTELEIMKSEVIEDIFEKKYEEQNDEFLKLLELYTTYKDDTPLKDLIINIYEFIESVPNPIEWLDAAVNDYNIDKEIDFTETIWGKLIIDKTQNIVNKCISYLEKAQILLKTTTLIDNLNIINEDVNDLKNISYENWDIIYNNISNKNWDRWANKGKPTEEEKEIKEKAKKYRDNAKDLFNKEIVELYSENSEELIDDILHMYDVLNMIKKLVIEFDNAFSQKKRENNIMDFSDVEHFALKLLVDEKGNPTNIAKQYQFEEILVDEYQDTNLIQEKIIKSVSNNNNIFMVGDVKQSIYGFRQSRPDLFMNKYNSYKEIDTENNNEGIKIKLYKNYRSRENIIDITNNIFKSLMSIELGELDYSEEEYLNFAANFEEDKIDYTTELYMIDKNVEEENETEEILENPEIEARLIAKKIKELINAGYKYKDMAILMRSPNNIAPTYEKELMEMNIPVFSDTTSDYLKSIEIDTIISLLKIIDNPLQDIPLVTIMRSPIFGFTDNELLEIRLKCKDSNYYNAVLESKENEKVKEFLDCINYFREREKVLPLNELIWEIYSKTGYYYYVRMMPDGKIRQANLKKLFEKAREYENISYKGLFNFISFIEKVALKKSSNMTSARIIGENDDVVRLMSIHKSKGLEFKIVFLVDMGKKINMQDMNGKIILDQSIGIGVNYINDGVEYPAITKSAINIKIKKETISEEMRILYVAITRAKEKLYIIGTNYNALKTLNDIEECIQNYDNKDKIDKALIEKNKSFLLWILLVYKYLKDIKMKFNIVNVSDLDKETVEENIENTFNMKDIDINKYKEVDKLLNWKYKYEKCIDIPSKTSVSNIKNGEVEKQIKYPAFEEEKNENGAKLGSLIHLVLQKLDGNVEQTIESLNINSEEKEILVRNKEIVENFMKSKIYGELKTAKEIHKEEAFYMTIKQDGEEVLVQGIIDLFYFTKDDKLVLVDYKTDKNINEQILKDRYTTQLQLYKQALEKTYNRKVDRILIYSTYLNMELEV